MSSNSKSVTVQSENSSMTNFEKIKDFHRASGLALFDIENLNALSDIKLKNLRLSLIKEEFIELKTAVKNKDHVEIIDALADMLYVIYGAGASFGINLDKLMKDYFSETAEWDDVDETWETNFEIIKNRLSNYLSKVHGMILNDTIDYDLLDNKERVTKDIDELSSKVDEFEESLNKVNFENVKKDFENISKSMLALLYCVYQTGAIWGIDLDKAYDLVHTSNMTKFCVNEDEAKQSVESYKKKFDEIKSYYGYPENGNEDSIKSWFSNMAKLGVNAYDLPNYRLSSDEKVYVIYNESTKKIIKSINYSPVKLKVML